MAKATATTKENGNGAVMPYEGGGFAIMQVTDKNEIQNILKENLGGMVITAQTLPNIMVPGSGGTVWEVPSLEGPISIPELTGIILTTQPIRRHYKKSFNETGGGTPPDCYSPDGLTGYGDPGGECLVCPNNKFVEGADGVVTKLCAERRLIFMVLKDDILPIVVHAPVKSLQNVQNYLVNVTRAKRKIYGVYTSLSLEKDKSTKGINYAKIVCKKVGDVEDLEKAEAYAMAIKPYLIRTIADMAQSGQSVMPGDSCSA